MRNVTALYANAAPVSHAPPSAIAHAPASGNRQIGAPHRTAPITVRVRCAEREVPFQDGQRNAHSRNRFADLEQGVVVPNTWCRKSFGMDSRRRELGLGVSERIGSLGDVPLVNWAYPWIMVRSALLVIDPQRDFFRPATPNATEFDEALNLINRAIAAFRGAGLPVVVVLHTSEAKPEGSWEQGAWESFDIDREDVHVKKGSLDAFWASDLDQRLQEMNIQRVVLSGFLSDMCVLGTYFGARIRGYESYVLRNATAALGRGLRAHVEAIVRTVALEEMLEEATDRTHVTDTE